MWIIKLGKEEAAYNISALYSLIGRDEESVKWLTKLISSADVDWLEKSKHDSDFDLVRSSEAYLNLFK